MVLVTGQELRVLEGIAARDHVRFIPISLDLIEEIRAQGDNVYENVAITFGELDGPLVDMFIQRTFPATRMPGHPLELHPIELPADGTEATLDA